MKVSLSCLLAAAVTMGACATAATDDDTSPLDDPRIGDEVRRLCVSSRISGFGEWDGGDGLILRKGPKERYLATLYRGCGPAGRIQRIGVNQNFGAGCLSRGDRIYVSADFSPRQQSSPFDSDVCRIKAIYKWDPSATAEDNETETEE